MKKIISIILALALIVLGMVSLSACNDSKKGTIGIIQFGSHASLNNCYDGIMAGLAENGIDVSEYNIEYLNSNFDPSVSQSQANTLVNKKNKKTHLFLRKKKKYCRKKHKN